MAPTAGTGSPFGLLGRTLGHSWSPQIHSQLGSAPYALFEREPQDVERFVREGPWRGINVTIPYKRDAFLLADEKSARAERLGVANTLVRRPDGSIYADNTDVGGFAWMLDRFCRRSLGAPAAARLTDAPVAVLGSGGASQAVRAALEEAGAQVCVISRHGADTYATFRKRHANVALVVNTTPVGMYPNCPASPLAEDDLAALPRLVGVLDVVYNPLRTGICLAAERLGVPSETGLGMLVAQARLSSELFQGHALPDELVESIEARIRTMMTNICLIGMPGVGKTSTGTVLAHRLGRPFVDMDEAFRLEYGTSAENYIRARGEDAFREAESSVLATTASRGGLVIACGGGVVERTRNRDLLRQNGIVVMLDRPVGDLSISGRPISQARGLEALAARRMGLYRSWADLTITCTGTPSGDADRIRTHLAESPA